MQSSVYRPGTLTSGLYQPLKGQYVPVFGPPDDPPIGSSFGGHLSNVIGKTNGIDWTNGLDAFGNPLDDRLRSYYEDLHDDPRKTQEEIRDLLANIRPDEEIPKEDRMGTPDALRYPLYDHQKLALKWMMDSEEGKNKGGILADDMGLGKTISTVALLVSRQSTDRIKTNLIVGPVALLKQWELELKKKLKSGHQLSILLLHGKNATYEELRRFDVVLTSYGKLGHEEKRYQKWLEHHPGADPSVDIGLAKSCPLVHPKSKFYRIILDEAQCIKNVNTFQAKGAAHLQSTYRWCLTGTPMMNGIHELYSLIQFLKIAPYHNQKEFSKRFGSLSAKSARSRAAGDYTRTRAMDALRVLLKAIMLRRMKTSKLDGKPLLDLPPKTEEVVHVVLDQDEMDFYKTLEARTKITFNKYLRAGTVGKNYSNVLVLLLRLRQACCHPHLNLDVEYVGSSEVSLDDMRNLAKTLAPDVVNRLKAANEEGFNCPICLDAVIDPTIVLPCGHNSCGECFSTLIAGAAENNLRAGEEGNSIKCPECRGPINPKQVINLTAFKVVHMPEITNSDDSNEAGAVASEASEDDSDSSDPDSDSEKDDNESGDDVDRNGNLKDFIVKDDEEEEPAEEGDSDNDDNLDPFVPRRFASSSKDKKSKSKSKKDSGKGKEKEKKEDVKPHMLKTLRLEAKKNKTQYKRYMKYLKKNWMTSAKVTKCCDILQGIQESGDKTIVFSQFTFLLDLLEIPIKYDLGIKYCRYDGGMTRQQRDAATLDFQDPNSRTQVMLVSLKAGNAGLNLTAANHVIIMDPFWNFFVESQAVDRAHRIGQQKPVQVHRLLTQETVEDRIIEIQEQKRKFVDAALDEGESKNLGRLSLQDLQFLFNG
ncbi:P-loop containing nucleoside triphosphate hydrolase protein [Coniella lustricola]|uniref:P-loop containing nucleoside triphosphate hydrolase protein n=1 Tax=Coniella lustricola TaxID=2025994 RepID=A0A2T3AE09_9PEZI|nr:P-loop containing nucleoside triphosphate hydrolase protein [Coniella lustricola]